MASPTGSTPSATSDFFASEAGKEAIAELRAQGAWSDSVTPDQNVATALTPDKIARLEQLAGVSPALMIALTSKASTVLGDNKKEIAYYAEHPRELVSKLPVIEKLRISMALDQIAKVPEGARLVKALEEAHAKNPNVKISLTRPGGGAFWSTWNYEDGGAVPVPHKITVSVNDKQGSIVAILSHELEHLRQAMELGDKYKGKVPHPDNVVLADRFHEADAEATAVEVAYKLKQMGYKGPWDAVTDKANWTHKIGEAYERAAQDPAAVSSGVAKLAAFDEWFKAKFSGTDYRVADYYITQAQGHFPEPDALEYLAKTGANMDKLSPADLRGVGGLSGVNYLDVPGGLPLDHPFYSTMNMTAEQAELRKAQIAEYEKLSTKFNAAAAKKGPETPQATAELPHLGTETSEHPIPTIGQRLSGMMHKANGIAEKGLDGVNVVTGTLGAIDAAKKGDVAGVAVNGATAGTGATSLAITAAKSMGAEVAPVLESVVRGSNVVLLVGTGAYQVYSEKGNFVDHGIDGKTTLGNKGERTAAVIATTVVGVGLATLTSVGTLGVVPAVAATAIVADKMIDAHRAWKEVDRQILENSIPSRLELSEPGLDGKASIYHFRHVGVQLMNVSKDMDDKKMTNPVARTKDGTIDLAHGRQLDMSDPKNIAEFERALDLNIEREKKKLKENDSMLPPWMRFGHSVTEYADAKAKLAEMTAAKSELEWFKQDLKTMPAAKPVPVASKFSTNPAAATTPAQQTKPKVQQASL